MKVFEFNRALGKPLVNLAYANGFPPETYRQVLAPLSDRYSVVALQMRPLWKDCAPETLHNWSVMGDDLLAGLDEIATQPVIGIGHSMGGVATMTAALKRPDRFRRLVLIEPTMLAPHFLLLIAAMRRLKREWRNRLVEGALRRRTQWESAEAAFENFRSKKLFARWSDGVLRDYVEGLTEPDNGGVRLKWSPQWEAQVYRTLPTDVYWLAGRVKVPLIVIRGELTDTFTRASALAFRLVKPRTQIITVPGVGHLLPQEAPQAVGQIIAEYLARP